MTNLFNPSVAISNMKVPPQDIDLLTFCGSNKCQKVAIWIEELRITQINLTSVSLYQALPEINHLRTDPKTRSEMLELVRPTVNLCTQRLAKEFLQQPLILPPSAQKTAILAQSLQKHLLDGHIICAKDLIAQKKLRTAQVELLTHSLFHACLAIHTMFFRCYQLYAQAPTNMWRQLHSIFQIAEFYELLEQPITPMPSNAQNARNILQAYTQAVALASMRPNQLSQYDIDAAYNALGGWAKHISLDDSTESNSPLFLINLSSDLGPAHKSRFHCEQFERVLELNVEKVINLISGANPMMPMSPNDDVQADNSNQLPLGLQVHLMECWSSSPERLKERKHADIEAQACVGLIDCHKKICGDTPFDQFINPPNENQTQPSAFMSGNFNDLVNSLATKKTIDKSKPEKQTVADVLIQNISAGGYCLLWQGALVNRIEAGELIGVKEVGRRSWNIGVIRWIRKLRAGSQLGVQLLTTQPAPYGAACMYDMGGYSDYMRAIHIPAPATDNQPPSLLTAAVPFQENTRARLKQEGTELDVRLTKCVLSTSKIRLFAFDTLSSEA